MGAELPLKVIRPNSQQTLASGVAEPPFTTLEKEAPQIKAAGFKEISMLSRIFLQEQRNLLVQTEGKEADYEILTSDSAIMIPGKKQENGDSVFEMVNLDATGADAEKLLSRIREEGRITYVGVTTFGRKNGNSSFTALTYCDCPVPEVNILRDISDPERFTRDAVTSGESFETGYIEAYEDGDKFSYRKRPSATPTVGSTIEGYTTGLTREVLDLAEGAGKMDALVTPIIQEHIAKSPFNTLSYYALHEKMGRPEDMVEFYKNLVSNHARFYTENGGNCSLFTLGLAADLRAVGLEGNILLYPSHTKGSDKDGHSAVLLKDGKRSYLADPGLTLPWIIPVDAAVPLFPFERVGDKLVLVQVNDLNDDLMPDITMRSPKGLQQFAAQSAIPVEEFRERLPAILARLHEARPEIKFDIHRALGDKVVNMTIHRATGMIQIGNGSTKVFCPVSEFLNNKDGALTAFLDQCGKTHVDGEAVVDDIRMVYSGSN